MPPKRNARKAAPRAEGKHATGAARKLANRAGSRATRKTARREPSELEIIPGVGVSIAEDLNRIGITRIAQLKDENPERLYDHICAADGVKHDRCLLYVFRCAVYYASKRRHDPEKLKWWNWKDLPLQSAPPPTSRTASRRAPTDRAPSGRTATGRARPSAATPAKTTRTARN